MWQLSKGAPDPHLLAGSPEACAHPPVEPVRARPQSLSSLAPSPIELTDEQHEEAFTGTDVGGLRAQLCFQRDIQQVIEHMF